MRYRKLDASGDYTFGTGRAFHVNSPDAVAQAISTRLKLWRREFFGDTSDGTPYLQDVLGKQRNPDVAVKQRILGTPDVTEIRTFASAYEGNTRRLTINATVQTRYGTVTINETLL
jgi:hypothetical protein